MRINPLRERWSRGEVASCLWIDIGWPVSVEGLVKLPYDAFETIKGVQNMRAIAAVAGLDMIYVGPNDLTIDHGGAPTYIASDPRVIKAMDDSITIAKENGIVAGTYAGSVDVAKAAVVKGFGLVSVGYAAKLMIKAAGDVLGQVFPGSA